VCGTLELPLAAGYSYCKIRTKLLYLQNTCLTTQKYISGMRRFGEMKSRGLNFSNVRKPEDHRTALHILAANYHIELAKLSLVHFDLVKFLGISV
jgi:hypothetical protein